MLIDTHGSFFIPYYAEAHLFKKTGEFSALCRVFFLTREKRPF